MARKQILKADANKAASLVTAYAKQQSAKAVRIAAKKTGKAIKAGSKVAAAKTTKAAKAVAKKGFAGLKKLFS